MCTLNWFDSATLKLQHDGDLFNGEMMGQILVKMRKHKRKIHQIDQERTTSYDRNDKINKAHWACIIYTVIPKPIADFWTCCFDWETLLLFQRNSRPSDSSAYFKHWLIFVNIGLYCLYWLILVATDTSHPSNCNTN